MFSAVVSRCNECILGILCINLPNSIELLQSTRSAHLPFAMALVMGVSWYMMSLHYQNTLGVTVRRHS